MEVDDLRKILNSMPLDAKLMVRNDDGGFSPLEFVESFQVVFDPIHSQRHYEHADSIENKSEDCEIVKAIVLLSYPFATD